MTIRKSLLVSAALLSLASASAAAEEELADPFPMLEPAAPVAVPHRPAVSASPPLKFLMRMFAPKGPKEQTEEVLAPAPVPAVVAEPVAIDEEPMVLVPDPPRVVPVREVPVEPKLPEPEVEQAEKPEPNKPKSLAASAAVIPIPRPRPEFFPPVMVAETAVAEDQVDSGEITGSIAAPQPQPTTPPAPQSEAAPESPPTPPIEVAEVAQSDDFLAGDPAQLLGEEEGLVPELSEPEAIPPPRPETGAPQAGALPPPGPTGEPYELMRTLQVLQDQIAQGSSEALATQRVLRREIDRSFAAAASTVWQDERNAAAAVTYVLSGGPPMVLRRLQTLDPKPAIDPRLISGVLAYAEGNEAEANEHLAELDVARMAPSMGAQLALAKSALAVRTDPAAARRFLAVARLLAPGTLVEEAAIRREIYIADRFKDAAAVEELARQYLARFRNSVYAGNFRNRFAAAISRIDFGKNDADFSRLEDLLLLVEPAARGQLYLTVALAAVVKGNSEAGAFAADRALALVPAGSKEEARAQLYRAAAMLADAEAFDTATDAMERCNRNLLGSSDQNLHDTVAATIAGIQTGTAAADETKRVAILDPTKDEPVETTPLMTRARDALTATDELVKGISR